MPRREIAPPADDEYPPAVGEYLQELTGTELFPILEAQMPALRARLRISEEKALHRYEPEKWTVKELLVHMADSERVFAYRALRIARGDETPLPGYDEQAYAATSGASSRPLASIIEELESIRRATLTLLGSLDEEGLSRRGVANARVVSARALAWVIAGHWAHHDRILSERYGI
ncbi:MAG: DinB family protein [Thermoanaerobaculia bacterium]